MDGLLVLLVLAVIGVGFVLYLVAHVANKVVSFLRHFAILYRFAAGHPLDGVHRHNGTFFQHPTKALHPTVDKSWWHWRPGWHRAAMRLGGLGLVLAIGAGLLYATTVTLAVFAALAAAGLVCGLLWTYARIRSYRHYRTYERPLGSAITPLLGAPPVRVAIERDRSRVAIHVPESFIGEERMRASIVQAVTVKTGIEAPDVDWSQLHGKNPVVVFTRSQPPPSRVSWADVEAAIRAAGPHDLMCGIGKKSADVFVSTKQDSPHFGEAMGTGAGKSNAAAFWLIQELMRGSVALVLDAKWISHPWTFKDMDAGYDQLPNVAYARTTEQLHNAMVWLGVELQRRTEAADRLVNAKGDVLGDVGPPLWIIAEELNLAMPRLKQHWAKIRGQEDPKRSPALDGMAAVSFAGRAVRMHLIVIGQMLTAASLGGGDVRENIGVRMMARYTANSWKMQTDLPMPPPSDVPGRVQIIASGTVREAQVPLMDFEQCRELAVSGTVTPCPDDMPGIAQVRRVALEAPSQRASDMGFVLPSPPGRPPGTLTLREAAREGLFPSLAAARRAVQRRGLDSPGRDGAAHLYYIADLAQMLRSNAS